MNIQSINTAIVELENMETTVENVQELANLYIVKDHMMLPADNVEKEFSDILPSYRNYCDVKRRYQLHEINENIVIDAIRRVRREINEFICTLYYNTDMPQEREQIKYLIEDLSRTF